MSSSGAIKWLVRLDEPRTIESLLSEVYGEAAQFGCLLENEVADLLNFYLLAKNPIAALSVEYNTEDWTLNNLVKEVGKKQILPEIELLILKEGKDARNELIHRLIGKKMLLSKTDMELQLAQIDELYCRIWMAHRLACNKKKEFAREVGITEEKMNELTKNQTEQARTEDEIARRLLEDSQ